MTVCAQMRLVSCLLRTTRVLEAPAAVTTAHGNGNGGDDTATSAAPAPATQPPAGPRAQRWVRYADGQWARVRGAGSQREGL